MMATSDLCPSDVMAMPVDQFEKVFGFRPMDALEKYWFAVNARRISEIQRAAVAAGIVGEIDLSQVRMD